MRQSIPVNLVDEGCPAAETVPGSLRPAPLEQPPTGEAKNSEARAEGAVATSTKTARWRVQPVNIQHPLAVPGSGVRPWGVGIAVSQTMESLFLSGPSGVV